jgi:hypothetical protein
VVSAILYKVLGCAPSTRRDHGAFAAAASVGFVDGGRSTGRSRLAGARGCRLATRRRHAACPGLPSRRGGEAVAAFLRSAVAYRPAPRFRHLGWRRPGGRPAALLCAIRPALGRLPRATRTASGSVHRPGFRSLRAHDVRALLGAGGGDWQSGTLRSVGGCRRVPGFRDFRCRRSGNRPAASLCAIRPVAGRPTRATRTGSGSVHRPSNQPRLLLAARASAGNGFAVSWLPGCSAGGTVSAAPTALDTRALGLWFSVSEVGSDGQR